MAGSVSRAALGAAALLSAGLIACSGGQETRPADGPGGRSQTASSGTATGRSTRPGGASGEAEAGSLDGGFVARVVDDFTAAVSRASAKGWPSDVILTEEGRPVAWIEVVDQRARGSADSGLIEARLRDALLNQELMDVIAAEPDNEAALAVQGELRADGDALWIEVRLFERRKQKILARTLLRDPPQ